MAITTGLTNSFRRDALQGIHLASHVYKFALYTNVATLGPATTGYSATNEVVGTGYSAGGIILTGYLVQIFSNIVCWDWDDPVWNPATITARGGLIYNDSLAGKDSVFVRDFGADYTSTNGPFTANFPVPGAATSLIQWAG